MVQLDLRSALSDRASEGKVAVVDEWPWDAPSTKAARTALTQLGLEGRVLVVLARTDEGAYKSFRNLNEVQLILASELNAYDVLCNDWIVFTATTLPSSGGDEEAEAASAPPAPKAKASSKTAVTAEEEAPPTAEAPAEDEEEEQEAE
jgi:large subunit ribosomal protein L4